MFRMNKKKKDQLLANLQEEDMQSPFRTAVKNLLDNKPAVIAGIVFLCIFAACFILPIWWHLDLSYQDPTQKNVAPGKDFMSLPSALKHNAAEISTGPTFGAGIDKDGVLYEWGHLSDDLKALPGGMGKLAQVAAGQDHIVAINTDGKLFSWGLSRPDLGQIPPELDSAKIKSINAGFELSVAVTEDGKIHIWGNPDAVDISPSKAEGEDVKSVVMNIQTGLALTEDGKVIPLAARATVFDAVPDSIQGKVKSLALSDMAAGAVLDDGTVAVWGNSNGSPAIAKIPKAAQGQAVSISAGRDYFSVILNDGTVQAWGGDQNGQIDVPSGLKNVASVDSHYYQNYAIDQNGNVTTWGLKGYLLGSDDLGRSMAIRLLKGGQLTMTVGFISVIISILIGILVGGLSGYYSGNVDIFLMRIGEVVGSIPFLPIALILSAVLGNRLGETGRIILIMCILGFLTWPGIAYMVRSLVLAERQKEFVTAAKALGVREKNIIFRHIVPNIATIILVSATLSFATCMLSESGLSFLGFGVSEPMASWGNMLNSARSSQVIADFWWRWVFPSIALGICTVSINLLGEGLRKALDPRTNER